jgi:hypothetical protein
MLAEVDRTPSPDRETAIAEALRGVRPGKARDWLERLLRDGERADSEMAARQDAPPALEK